MVVDIDLCRKTVLGILEGKILVGHGLKIDMRALGISHPWNMIGDTAKYEPFMKQDTVDSNLVETKPNDSADYYWKKNTVIFKSAGKSLPPRKLKD
jgi:hypothetical protein